MIIGIDGTVVKKEATFVHIKTDGGLTYKVNISLFCAAKIDTSEVSLHVTQVIREDAHIMYGFIDIDEKKVFDTLIKINGVGPSTALAVCSTLNPSEFSSALASGDVRAFQKVPGIGPKSAKRILVELSNFELDSQLKDGGNSSVLEATMALESLGFKKDKIKKALSMCSATDTSTLIKEALKQLG